MGQGETSEQELMVQEYREQVYDTIQAALAVAVTRKDYEVIAAHCESIAGYRDADLTLADARQRMAALDGQPDIDDALEQRITLRAKRRKIVLLALCVLSVAGGLAVAGMTITTRELSRRYHVTLSRHSGALKQYAAEELASAKAALAAKEYRTAVSRIEQARDMALERKRLADEERRQRLAEEAERRRRAEEAERKRLAEQAEREAAERKRLAEQAEREAVQAGDTVLIDLGGGEVLEMAWCPPGRFTRGSPIGESDRRSVETQHPVTLTQGFWLGKCEVTQAQWEALMGSNPSYFKNAGRSAPVENVSWHDCQAFIEKLNLKPETRSAKYGGRFRLPTEAEWEYACRAGTTTAFHYGNLLDSTMANMNGNRPYGEVPRGFCRQTTMPVGSFHANAWGLHDMHGNVWEWCSDGFADYPAEGVTDPAGAAAGSLRIYRGGSWGNSGGECRSAFRNWSTPGNRYVYLGMRVARDF